MSSDYAKAINALEHAFNDLCTTADLIGGSFTPGEDTVLDNNLNTITTIMRSLAASIGDFIEDVHTRSRTGIWDLPADPPSQFQRVDDDKEY